MHDLITSGTLGNVTRVFADNGLALDPETSFLDGKHRMVNPKLAGGALLDMGIYALTWVFQCLYHTLPEGKRMAPKVTSSLHKYAPTGVDESTAMLITFPRG